MSHQSSNQSRSKNGNDFESYFTQITGIKKMKKKDKPRFTNVHGLEQLIDFDFSNMLNGSIKGMTEEQKQTWAQKQTYIGLGFALVAAATEGVDSTPMEGFVPQQVDEVLGLKELGLKSSVVLTLGYRDADNDYLASLKKVRWNDEKFFIRK